MKAARILEFGPPGVIRFEEIPCQEPAGGQLVVRVKAAGVGPWEAPCSVFRDAGVDLTLASPEGRQPSLDPESDLPENQIPAMARFKQDERAKQELSRTVKRAAVSAAKRTPRATQS